MKISNFPAFSSGRQFPISKFQIKQGYIALSAVLIISFVVLAITTSVTFLSIGEAQSSLALLKGEQTLQFVEECAEEALWKARGSSSYTGGVLTLPEGSCSVTIGKAGNQWTIDVSNIGTSYTRTVRIVITRDEVMITLISWKEI